MALCIASIPVSWMACARAPLINRLPSVPHAFWTPIVDWQTQQQSDRPSVSSRPPTVVKSEQARPDATSGDTDVKRTASNIVGGGEDISSDHVRRERMTSIPSNGTDAVARKLRLGSEDTTTESGDSTVSSSAVNIERNESSHAASDSLGTSQSSIAGASTDRGAQISHTLASASRLSPPASADSSQTHSTNSNTKSAYEASSPLPSSPRPRPLPFRGKSREQLNREVIRLLQEPTVKAIIVPRLQGFVKRFETAEKIFQRHGRYYILFSLISLFCPSSFRAFSSGKYAVCVSRWV